MAQTLRQTRRAGAEKIQHASGYRLFVDMALEWLWSPEQISGVGKRAGKPVSHEGNSRHVRHDRRRGGERDKKRRQEKRRYRRGYGQKRTPMPDAVSIEKRPAAVDERSRPGNRPGVAQTGHGCQRHAGRTEMPSLPDKKVSSTETSVVKETITGMLKTIFAHPCASCERGLNDNVHGLLRPFIPKGTDLRTVSTEELARYQGALTCRPGPGTGKPRKVLAHLVGVPAGWRAINKHSGSCPGTPPHEDPGKMTA